MKRPLITLLLIAFVAVGLQAQEKPTAWTLQSCMNYALKNNIQIRKSNIAWQQDSVSTLQAKAQLFPNLTASIGQDFVNYPVPVAGTAKNVYSGNYGLSSSMTLYNGGKLMNNIQEQKILQDIAKSDVKYSEKSIQFSILQSYLQILYAAESVKINKATLEVSEFQFNRGKDMLKAGSISQVDLAQLESQYNSDKYQLVVAQNALESQKLVLKQLLELPVTDSLNIDIPELSDVDVLIPLAPLKDIYANALNVMPQIKGSKLSIQAASVQTAISKSGYYPKVSLNASVGTNNSSISNYNFGQQLQDGLNEGIGVSVSIPIFQNRNTKSAVEINKLAEKTAELNLRDTEKTLLSDVQSAYQNAISAQSQYVAAKEKVNALETSYNLIDQQYALGLKNTLDLLTEKNNLIAARQGLLQAKYMSIMNVQLLNLYQDRPIDIK